MVAILGYSREQITNAVQDMYTAVARTPTAHFHFPVGESACRLLGYGPEEIGCLPRAVMDSFAGVGCPHRCNMIRPGDTVLDVGAGAGVDSMLAATRVGPEGQVLALDITPAMARKLKDNLEQAETSNVTVLQGTAEHLPLASESVDCVTSNGALNLVPDKRRAVSELFRVLRPGGRLQIADVVIRRPVTVDCHTDPRLWVECVVGATVDEDLLELFRASGFEHVEVVNSHDYFAHSPSAQTREVAEGFGARSIEVRMRRGEEAPHRLKQFWQLWGPHRLWSYIRRRGLAGTASLIAALLACYGTLAAVALLALLGIGTALNETVWAGAIALFSVLAVIAVAAGIRRHRTPWPTALAAGGGALILYVLFVDYSLAAELAAFGILTLAVIWDLHLRRREQRRILGLKSGAPT